MDVIVNNNKKSGKTLKDVISGEYYVDGANIVIIKETRTETEKESKKYHIKTTKGSFVIGISDENETVNFWNENYKSFENKPIIWKSVSDVAFGNIEIDLDITSEKKHFKKWDVVLSVSGLDKSEGNLIFVQRDTSESYGLKNPKIGILIGGKRVLKALTSNDLIVSIERIRESKEHVNYLLTTDLNLNLEEGWKIYTYCTVEFNGPSKSVEHALAILENGTFEISENTNTYVTDCRLQTLLIDEENPEERDRGTITVRNIGNGVGKLYIYQESRVSSLSHTVVGKINNGIELIDFSDKGRISIKSNPERLNAVGKTQKEAKMLFEKHGVSLNIDGHVDDNSIIVEQIPEYTMEILKNKEVTVKGISPEKLIYITIFDDKAPNTAWYFRKTTGLTTKKIGVMKVYFKHGDISMFDRNSEYSKGLLPENIPNTALEGGTIAVTNMVKKYKGYIGIRTLKNDKYGPTGETFEGTNVVGKVVKNIEILKNIKQGENIYILEVNK
ncbi:conserved hypothetical protein [Methanococcus vannielii SB]|uniref:UPF0288 protein Mevan_1159 n=1 Tax=Methanococcus vannielii (strain ATCC 35089 / DSM 1224 / JCM 13029 / OCM 148 / SB) TaxID=406327 RepID=A6URD5_METVS|nr:methanogenesis marker 3 protein [Methanococcus vannielii]ABR55057.1 conserved hypothetical protein [Methanococcus vannielii SB]